MFIYLKLMQIYFCRGKRTQRVKFFVDGYYQKFWIRIVYIFLEWPKRSQNTRFHQLNVDWIFDKISWIFDIPLFQYFVCANCKPIAPFSLCHSALLTIGYIYSMTLCQGSKLRGLYRRRHSRRYSKFVTCINNNWNVWSCSPHCKFS